jgi:hypothetical protein
MAFGFDDFWFWPFGLAFGGVFLIIVILLLAFWIWMIVDVAKRKFKNDLEKIIWLLIIVFVHWIGALVYFIVIRMHNPKGLAKR